MIYAFNLGQLVTLLSVAFLTGVSIGAGLVVLTVKLKG